MAVTIIVVFCCVALLPSIIHSDGDSETKFQTFLDFLNQNAEKGSKGQLINRIFRLSKNGFLGRGGFSLTYKAKFEGNMTYNGKEIALKFTPFEDRSEAANEYVIYTYLMAIDKPTVESFGVPAVYYFGKSGEYIMMAITLMQPTFNDKCKNNELLFSDILILFREFAKITKYIHSCGIRHDDIKHENIMFDRHRTFIIDYNIARKMDQVSTGGTLRYKSRGAHFREKRCAKDDWESFLYSVCRMVKLDLDWFKVSDPKLIYQLKQNTTKTKQKIERIGWVPLRDVISKFSQYVFNDDEGSPAGYPNYDGFYQFIEEQMEKYKISQPALVSWLTPDERKKAIQHWEHNPTLNISDIKKPVPKSIYPDVNPSYFLKKYQTDSSSDFSGITRISNRLDKFRKSSK